MRYQSVDFVEWITQCAVLCALGQIVDKTYKWDEENTPLWKGLYDAGVSPEDAVRRLLGTLH